MLATISQPRPTLWGVFITAPILCNPPLSNVCRITDPLDSLRPMQHLYLTDKRQEIKRYEVMSLPRVSADIGESPFHIRDKGDNETVRLSSRSQCKPGSPSVHSTELPVLLSFYLGNKRSDDGLAFVHRKQILNGTRSMFIER